LASAEALEFAGAQVLAQQFFGTRDQALANFELIARILEEVLCFKLLRAEFAESAEVSRRLMRLSEQLAPGAIAAIAEGALKAHAAIEAMANSRLQAERWWMAAGAALRGETSV
jgi:hypothetical protein